ncbi:hypothetical protein FACS1894191_4830 [Clostridia bacterium]|nr:hypothetical protein FACS1894191_4830 [Clostridia bacterium]
MPIIKFPYGDGEMSHDFPDERFLGSLTSEMHSYRAPETQEELVRRALENPVGSPRLGELARGKRKIVIIASDHTRPVPSKIILPPMLAELRAASPEAEITILVATGCHRDTTRQELADKFGPEIMGRERIVVHDCDAAGFADMGLLPSGGRLLLNPMAAGADLLVAEGFIEPHFFAGFSGGRKSVLPGVAARETVLYNHNAEFIAHPCARTGVLRDNPIHADMLYAAKKAKLAFICNVVIDAEKRVVFAAAGDCDKAHLAGCEFLSGRCRVQAGQADIVITSNGGYPLDQNIYQAVKGMTAAEAAVRPGGVIVMLARSGDGHGAPEFYHTFKQEKDLGRMLARFMSTPKNETRMDQWQSQIFARVLGHAKVVYVSDAPDDMVRDMHMLPAHSVAEAMNMAETLLGDPDATVTAIPDGVAVVAL